MLTNNTRILTKDWKHSNLNDPLVKEVFQFIYDLVYVHKVSPTTLKCLVDPRKILVGSIFVYK